MRSYNIRDDGGREVRFKGVELSVATTQETDSLRWTETRIWRTQAGKYILQKVGRSIVFHASDGCKYGTKLMQFELPSNAKSCPVCKPSVSGHGVVKMENDRFTVHVSDTADGLVESARLQDEDGVTYITRVNREALEDAAEKDSAIHDAYMVTRVE